MPMALSGLNNSFIPALRKQAGMLADSVLHITRTTVTNAGNAFFTSCVDAAPDTSLLLE
jgi:hypothetical protein